MNDNTVVSPPSGSVSSLGSATGGNNNAQYRSGRRKHRTTTRSNKRSNNKFIFPRGGSMVWSVLWIGVILCLMDVAYIVGKLDGEQERLTSLQQKHQASSSITANNNNNNKAFPFPGDNNNNKKKKNDKEDDEDLPLIFLNDTYREQLRAAKTPLINILREARVELDDATLLELPTWDEVVRLYGDEPRIWGIPEMCRKFQTQSDPAEHFVSTAGTFNSGTNLMAELLIANCHMQKRMEKYGRVNRGVRWQVPWGKHSPPGDEKFRNSHKTSHDSNVNATEILPAVTIRDPYVWMQSMCRHAYTAHWTHAEDHCPNLVLSKEEQEQVAEEEQRDAKYMTYPIFVRYAEFNREHESLAHMWNDWYDEYMNKVEFPRIVVRFEDLVFHAKEVTTKVCQCAGGSLNQGQFEYIVNSAKKGLGAHGAFSKRTGFVTAMIKYGSAKHRFEGFTKRDLQFAREMLNDNLTTFFNYKHATPDDEAKVA